MDNGGLALPLSPHRARSSSGSSGQPKSCVPRHQTTTATQNLIIQNKHLLKIMGRDNALKNISRLELNSRVVVALPNHGRHQYRSLNGSIGLVTEADSSG